MTDDNLAFYDAVFKDSANRMVPVLLLNEASRRPMFVPASEWSKELPKIFANYSNHNVFYGIGLIDSPPASGRGSSSDVSYIRAFYFDVDMPVDETSKYAAQSDVRVSIEEVKLAFAEMGLSPSAITITGNGVHVYALLENALFLETEADRQKAADLWRSLTTYVRQRVSPLGWRVDNVSDLSRLDRAPGGVNLKDSANPKPVEVAFFDPERLYGLGTLRALVPSPERTLSHRIGAFEEAEETFDKLADFEAIQAADPWVGHCIRDAATLSYPEWFAFLMVLAHCENGEALAHRYSEPHPGYSEAETSAKFAEARKLKPPTYDYIRSIVPGDPGEAFALYETAHSPISFGYMEPALAALLPVYAFVVGEDRYVRLDTLEARSRKAFDAENQHLLKSPSFSFLSSKLALKPARRDYQPGTGRLIREADGSLTLNSYQAPTLTAAQGEWPLIGKHFETVFPDESDRNAVLDRMAMAVQQPGKKIKSGVLIVGPEGGGKGTITELLKGLVGSANVVTLPSSAIDDPFQDDRINKQINIFNEVSGIRRSAVNSLKELVTESHIMVQGKGIPRFLGRTPTQVWITTNDDAALQLNDGDRRWLVLSTPNIPPDSAYFDDLYAAIPAELAGFAYALSTRDISHFNPNARPQATVAKEVMIRNAASDLEYAIREALGAEIGVFAKDFGTAEDVIRAVMANGWSGRPLHSKSVGSILGSIGAAKMGRITLPNGTKPYFHAWRNQHEWLQADRESILAHRGISSASADVIKLHPTVGEMVNEADAALARVAS